MSLSALGNMFGSLGGYDHYASQSKAIAQQMAVQQRMTEGYLRMNSKAYKVLGGNCRNCGAPIDAHQCSYCKTVHY